MFVYHSALGGFKHIKARKQVTAMSTMERTQSFQFWENLLLIVMLFQPLNNYFGKIVNKNPVQEGVLFG